MLRLVRLMPLPILDIDGGNLAERRESARSLALPDWRPSPVRDLQWARHVLCRAIERIIQGTRWNHLNGTDLAKSTVKTMPAGPPSNPPPFSGQAPTGSSGAAADQTVETPYHEQQGAAGTKAPEPGKIIRLMYCEVCRTPVSSKAIRRFQFFHMVLCNTCYNKFYRRGSR